MKCKKCDKPVKTNELKCCSQCSDNYHYQCLGITSENFGKESKQVKSAWKCLDCKTANKRDVSVASTKCQDLIGSPAAAPASSGGASFDDLKEHINLKINEATTKILTDLKSSMIQETESLSSALEEMKTTIQFISAQYDDLLKATEEKKNVIVALKSENEQLRSDIAVINSRLDQMDQQVRNCNVEIQCVPEHKNENICTIVTQLAKVASYDLKESDIVNCHRVPKQNQESNRPRSIVVKFISPRVRDNILASVRNYNKDHSDDKFNTSLLGIGGEKRPVYVTEHLSLANKKLHSAARAVAKEKNYEFVWVRGGRVLVRKDINSKPIVVSDDILKSL